VTSPATQIGPIMASLLLSQGVCLIRNFRVSLDVHQLFSTGRLLASGGRGLQDVRVIFSVNN
jgi:hypothetical protein